RCSIQLSYATVFAVANINHFGNKTRLFLLKNWKNSGWPLLRVKLGSIVPKQQETSKASVFLFSGC
ncbi:MAG: hypothetical protein WAM00_06870, partial [Salegentibacter sp.]